MNSKELSSGFHDTIGKGGLSSLSTRKWDKSILSQVASFLEKEQKILDVGCGYGRVAIPLLKKGYDVHGIDLSRRLIGDLKMQYSSEEINHRFKVADMCDLPFKNNSFDVVICLWSAFDSLLFRKEQLTALKEMRRILRKGGFAFIEGFTYMEPTPEDVKSRNVRGHGNRIRRDYSHNGLEYFHYNHDVESMRKILVQSGVKDFSVTEEWFGWRERMITTFTK